MIWRAAALFALTLALAAVPAPAHAQVQAFAPPAPFGPLTLGMSSEAARSALPGAEWDASWRAPALDLHGLSFRAQIAFAADSATLLHLTTDQRLSEAGCREQHRAIVEAEMRQRSPFTQRHGWHHFYHDPDAPRGHFEGNEFIAAPNTPVAAVAETLIDPRVQFNSVVLSYDGSAHGQWFYSAQGTGGEISAHSITREGETTCRITMSASNPRAPGGLRLSATPEGAVRLAERLATAERVGGQTYLDTPSGYDFSRHYPGPALEANVSGVARLNCLVLADGALDCVVQEETPPDYQFGAAAQRIVRGFRVDVFATAPGQRIQLNTRFVLPD